MVVDAWLARAAAVRPHAPALQTPTGSLTYAELHAQAAGCAAQLAARGAGAGDRVAIALPAGLDFARALHACLLLRASAVPVDLRLGADERARVCEGASVIVREPLEPRTALPAGARESAWAHARHDLDTVAAVIHTSGTTAAPRPVELTYGNFLWSALGSAVALGCEPGDRWLCALPLSHVGGLSILMRSAIYATTAVVHERFETDRVLDELANNDTTIVSVVATTLTRLLDAGLTRPPALRCALAGGGPVPAELLRRAGAAGVPVSLTYGLTEACSQVTTTPVAELSDTPSAGPPLFCTQIALSPDGEIRVKGPTLARSCELEGDWLATGDLGRLDSAGRLWVTGRKADTIVSGGENVAPAEVEAVLEAHPDVLEAAVLGRPHPEWGEAVAAIVVARRGSDIGERDLRAHCAAALAPYKIPKEFALTGEPLPRTPSGKLLRRDLR